MSGEGAVAAAIAEDHVEDQVDDGESERNRCDPDPDECNNKQSKKRGACAKSIPIEIVECILVRLPAKSVGRFRSVCRRWLALTRGARFIHDHHRLAGGASGGYRLLVSHFLGEGRLSFYDEIKHSCQHLKLHGDENSHVFTNPVNGLFGLLGTIMTPSKIRPISWELCLLNPVTGETLQLPRNREMDGPCSHFTGLGFDASRGAYKMVTFKGKVSDKARFSACMVLTVGTREWRHVGDVPCAVWSQPVFLDGAIHWLAHEFDGLRPRLPAMDILVFDVKDETFRFIPAPNALSNLTTHGVLYLRVLKGHICIVHALRVLPRGRIFPVPLSARIWMLGGSSANLGWKQECEIDTSFWLDRTGSNDSEVIDIRGEKVLMQSGNAIYSYDLLTKTLHTLYLTEVLRDTGVIAESLVSPRKLC